METSFLRDAIDRITDLARPFTMEADGHKFCSKALLEVKAEEFSPTVYEVDTLDALVKLILTEGLTLGRMLYVRVDSARKVTVATTYNGGELRNPYERFPLYEAMSDVPGVTIGRSMSQEQAMPDQPLRCERQRGSVLQPGGSARIRHDRTGRQQRHFCGEQTSRGQPGTARRKHVQRHRYHVREKPRGSDRRCIYEMAAPIPSMAACPERRF